MYPYTGFERSFSSNEVLAREGIDTPSWVTYMSYAHSCSNEVLAREGIDTANPFNSKANGVYACSNEVLAREGIDTTSTSIRCGLMRGSNEVLAREGIDTNLLYDLRINSAPCSNEVLAREGIDTDKVHNVIDVWVTP